MDMVDSYQNVMASLLMDKDVLFRSDRSDSIFSLTSEDMGERDDFLPMDDLKWDYNMNHNNNITCTSSFPTFPSSSSSSSLLHQRNRAFSWDLSVEEGLSGKKANSIDSI